MVALIVLYAVALGAATFVEHNYSTATAMEYFYKSWWMFILQGVLAVNFVAMSVVRKLWQQKKWGVIMLHYGFVVILLGAMTTYLTGVEGMVHLREGESSRRVSDMSGRTQVAELPFDLTLEDFSLTRYGHSGSPSSFVSQVEIEGKTHEISMNNVLHSGAWRFYQTSYDPDEGGTFLTASRDRAGVCITYTGYGLLCLGLILTLFSRKSRFRRLASSLGVLLLLVAPGRADEISDKFERLMIQNSSGRVQAVGSYAEDVVRKISREKSFRGLSASQILIGMTTNPEAWAREKIIKDDKGNHIAFVDVIGADGSYLLADQVEEIYRKAPRERTKADKEIIKLDERINIVDNLFSGRMLAIFPTSDGRRWYSTGDDLSDLSSSPKDSLLVGKIYSWFATELTAGNKTKAMEVLSMIETFQNAKSEDVDTAKIEGELLYNKLDTFKWCGFAFMGIGLLLSLLLVAGSLSSGKALRYACYALIGAGVAVFLFQSFGMGLRWWVSGRAPWTNAYETMVYVAWATAVAGFVFMRRSKITFSLSIFMAGVLLFVSTLSWMDPQITPLAPVLDSYWLIVHVAVITASYGFFGVGFLLGVTSMIMLALKRNNLKEKIAELTAINSMALTIGLVLMTIGTFLGAIWANESWGRYWGWDPKETWALITVLAYSIVTHMYMIKGLGAAYAMALASILALSTVLMTFFGVNYFLSGMHSYGADSAPTGLYLIYWIYGALVLLSLVPILRKNYK